MGTCTVAAPKNSPTQAQGGRARLGGPGQGSQPGASGGRAEKEAWAGSRTRSARPVEAFRSDAGAAASTSERDTSVALQHNRESGRAAPATIHFALGAVKRSHPSDGMLL